MAQQVLMPQNQGSDLDTILKGLQIAATGYGIYADTQKLDMLKSQKEAAMKKAQQDIDEKNRLAKGEYNKGELDQLAISGARYSEQAPQGIQGVIAAKIKTPDGLKDVFITPKSEIDRIDSSLSAKDKAIAEQNRIDQNRQNDLNDLENKRIFESTTKFQDKPRVRDIKSKYESATTALELLKNGEKYPNLDQLAYRAVFSAMERGVFRQEDAEAYGLPVGFLEKIRAQFKQGVDNIELQPAERKSLMAFMSYVKNNQRAKMHQEGMQEAKSVAHFVKGRNSEEIYQMLGGEDALNSMDEAAIELSKRDNSGPIPGVSAPDRVPAFTGPKIGDIEDGHQYIGGNPADPMNWKKVP